MSQTFVDARDTLKMWDYMKNSVKERCRETIKQTAQTTALSHRRS